MFSAKTGRKNFADARTKEVLYVGEEEYASPKAVVVRKATKGVQGWQQLVAMSALVTVICSVDRAAVSVTILPMAAQLNWDDSTKGLVSSAFFLGYTVSNVLGGILATKFPPGIVLAAGVAIWSLLTIATPQAAASGLGILLACRIVMGLGEGVTFPCIQNIVAPNVPEANKAQSLALIYSGSQVGTVVSLLAAPVLISAYDWPSVFFVFGAIGFVWLAGWLPQQMSLQASSAADAGSAQRTDKQTRSTARQRRDTEDNEDLLKKLPWRAILRNKPFLAILIAHAGWSFGYTICYAWLPTFYFATYGLSVAKSAGLSALPWIATVAVTNIGGFAADKLVRDGTMSRLASRKLLQALGSFLPAALLLFMAASAAGLAPIIPLPWAVAILSSAISLGGLTATGFLSNHQDLSSRYAGILFGITNAASSTSGAFGTYATGRALDATGSWASVFVVIAAVYAASAAVYLAWASSENQFDGAAAPVRSRV